MAKKTEKQKSNFQEHVFQWNRERPFIQVFQLPKVGGKGEARSPRPLNKLIKLIKLIKGFRRALGALKLYPCKLLEPWRL